MSWSIGPFYATKTNAKLIVDQSSLPDHIKAALTVSVDLIPDGTGWDAGTHVMIQGTGHAGQINGMAVVPFKLQEPTECTGASCKGK